MKHVAVIANDKEYTEYLTDNLRIYFREGVEFHLYSTSEVENRETVQETYIVISAFTIFQQVRKKMKEDAKLVILDLALNKSHLDLLHKINKGTRALLVNIDYRSCMEVITMIYNAGFHDLELIPFYPGADYDRRIKIAVTPDEVQLVPKDVITVLNIGQRVVDTNSIIEIAHKFELESPFASEAGVAAKKNTLTARFGMEKVLGDNESLRGRIDMLLKLVRQGIIITDVYGKIYLANDMAMKMLKSRTDMVEGFKIAEILPELGRLLESQDEQELSGGLIAINGTNLIVSVSKIISEGEQTGEIYTLDSFAEAEDRQHRLRSKMTGTGHRAVYRFTDILGRSESILEAKQIAKRMASSDSSMILYGESGTGKELFAQSIHNHSERRNYHFVAVNCSALPENLLESELYGYEDGAFSGARKGGKIGLFELAHNGTLFLDEIGELPLSLQAKLLRAIEERRILRVGGMDMIDVNVRIITATNRDLLEMVGNKEFRSDLYYRLNVLPVHIPSLSARREDILPLFDSFCVRMGARLMLSPAARERMERHPWPGNVRELKNIAEYLTNLGSETVEAGDIPFLTGSEIALPQIGCAPGAVREAGDDPVIRSFLINEGRNSRVYVYILEELEKAYRERRHLGRNRLASDASDRGLFITEQEIKTGLAKLSACGFVSCGRGRAGTAITKNGEALLVELKKWK